MILLLQLVDVIMQCLYYRIYLLLLAPLIMMICFQTRKYIGIRGNALKLIKSYFSIVLNVFKLIMFCLTLLILCVMFIMAQFSGT